MTWVKICGLRTAGDVAVAESAGADAVGFVIGPSPRRVAVEEARAMAADATAMTVLVTMDLPSDRVKGLIASTGVDALQPHGVGQTAAAEAARELGVTVLLPIRMTGPIDWAAIPATVTPLLDAPRPGGGRVFDWSIVGGPDRPFILAGGLNPDNVLEAIDATGAWGVDVSTGVESSLGRKDPALIHRFVELAKSR